MRCRGTADWGLVVGVLNVKVVVKVSKSRFQVEYLQ